VYEDDEEWPADLRLVRRRSALIGRDRDPTY
jgi:hypothetical protein